MTVALDYPPSFVEPAHLWLPPGRIGSYGPETVGFMDSLGHPVDAEQAADIDCLQSYGAGGTYLTLETAYLEARQQGKTDRVALPIALTDVFLFGSSVTWTAHRLDTVRDVFKTVKRLIDANSSLSSQVSSITEQASAWGVELKPLAGRDAGAVFEFRIRGGGGGRGVPRDIWVVDEALYVDPASVGDRLPTLSSKPNPQVRYVSSACKVSSTHLRKVVRRGRARDSGLILIERCAPGSFEEPGCEMSPECRHVVGTPGCALDREELWHLGNHRIGRSPGPSYQFIRTERASLSVTEFARERYGWHEAGPEDDARHPLNASSWAQTVVETSPEQIAPMFFITVGPDGDGVVTVAHRRPAESPDRRVHVELADAQPGTHWLPGRLEELAKAWPDAVFGAGKAGPVAGMVETGLPVTVELLGGGELAQACRHLEKMVKTTAFTRAADADVELSFAGAVSKLTGDGMWTWDWKESTGLARIAGYTGALWLLEKYRNGGPEQQFFGARR